ncbi:hypothetical protein FQA47_023073 [Oryzias melastigma]|uniref:Uncharacterized protein n=1 Tax=Oryzias melastigma TaxID=30732 RepID=A0A834CK99_ORYME|nr:hypothetical protein FQA47_023073 [Oryzias melastigma]
MFRFFSVILDILLFFLFAGFMVWNRPLDLPSPDSPHSLRLDGSFQRSPEELKERGGGAGPTLCAPGAVRVRLEPSGHRAVTEQ